MSEDKKLTQKEALNQINKTVKSINRNTSHFGTKIKVPSDSTEDPNAKNQEQLNFTEYIIGALGNLVWGKQNIDGKKVKNLISKSNETIYSCVKSISDSLKEKNDNKKTGNINVKNVNQLGGLVELIKFVKDNPDYSLDSRQQQKVKSLLGDMSNILSDMQEEFQHIEVNISKDTLNAINAIGTFFDALASIGDIGAAKMLQIKFNLKFFKTFLIKELPSLFKDLELLNNSVDDNTDNAMESLSSILNSIIKFADIDKEKMIQMVINLKMFKNFVSKELYGNEGLLTMFCENTKTYSKDQERAVESMTNFLSNIVIINDKLGLSDLLKLQIKFKYLNFILKSYIEDNIEIANSQKELETKLNKLSSNLIDKLDILQSYLVKIDEISKIWPKHIPEIHSKNVTNFIACLTSLLASLNKSKGKINSIIQLDKTAIESIRNFIEIGDLLTKAIPNWKKIDIKSDKKDILSFAKIVGEIVKVIVDKLQPEINQLQNTPDKLDMALNAMKTLNEVCNVAAISSVSVIGIKTLKYAANAIVYIVHKLASLDDKDVQKSLDTIERFNRLVMICGAALLAGALVMSLINFKDLLLFSWCLGTFVVSIVLVLSWLAKPIDKALSIGTDLMLLIMVSGLTLVLGSMFMKFIDIDCLILFGIILATFVLAVALPFIWVAKNSETILTGAKEFGELIFLSGATLVLGALFMKFIEIENLVLFATVLTAFIWSVTIPLIAVSGIFPYAISGLYGIKSIITQSALVLIIGGLVMKFIKPRDIILFEILLLGLIWGVTGAYLAVSKNIKNALAAAKTITLLILTSAAAIIIGALVMSDPKRAFGALLFTWLLGSFVTGIVVLLAEYSEKIKLALPIAIGLCLLVAVCAASLMIGANFIAKDPNNIWYILAFGAILGVFVYFIIEAMQYIAEMSKEKMTRAVIGMMVIGAFMYVATKAMQNLVEASLLLGNDIGSWLKLAAIAVIMYAMIGVLAAIIIGIGAASEASAGMLWIGIAAVVAIAASIWVICDAIRAIAESMLLIAQAASIEIKWESIFQLLVSVGALGLAVAALGQTAPLFILGGVAAKAMSFAIGAILDVIKKWAMLEYPIYKPGTTEIIGYRQITEGEKTKAIKNIGDTIKLLFDTIFDVYEDGKQKGYFPSGISGTFTGGIIGMLTMSSPIMKIFLASKSIGMMLSEIADALKDWADLKIPIYNGNKIVDYKTINDDAFVKAANNIKRSITTLAGAVFDAYDENPELFEGAIKFNIGSGTFTSFLTSAALSGSVGPSKFERISKALGIMGIMLGDVARGIKDWTELTIPVYGNGGKIINYKTIESGDFIKAAENIKKVISTLIGAINDAYDQNASIFDSVYNINPASAGLVGLIMGPAGAVGGSLLATMLNYNGPSKFGRIAKSLGMMGRMLSDIADGIKDWSELKIPVYKNGRIIDYYALTNKEFTKAAENIKKVVTTLFEAISDIGNNDKNSDFIGTDDIFGDSPATKVINRCKYMASMLADVAGAVKDWAEFKIPVYGKNSGKLEIIDYLTIGDDEFKKVGENVGSVLTILVTTLNDLYHGKTKDGTDKDLAIFLQGDWYKFDTPAEKVLNSISTLGNAIGSVGQGVKDWADLKIPEYSYKNGKMEITNYVTLTNGMLTTTVPENIKNVITALFNGLKTANEGIDTDDLEDIIEQMIPLGNGLCEIAKGLQLWAELKIPVYEKDENGKVVINDYIELTETTFQNIGENVGKVVTGIFTSLSTAMEDPKVKPFLSGRYFNRVMDSLTPMSDMLSKMGEGLKLWSEMAIPQYTKNDKGIWEITGYLDINSINFDEVGKNVGKVITGIVMAISKSYYGQIKVGTEYKSVKDLFDLKDGKSEFNIIVTSIGEISQILTSLAEGIIAMADLKIPVYRMINGELKIVDYTRLTDKHFTAIETNIKKILGALITSIDGNTPLIEKLSNNGMSTGINNFTKLLTGIVEILNNFTTAIGYYASGEFPILTYDSNGKLVKGKMISINGKNNSITSMQENIQKVIQGLIQGFTNSFKTSDNKKIDQNITSIFANEQNNILNSAVNKLKTFVTTLKHVIETVDAIGKTNFTELDAESIKTNIRTVLTNLYDILFYEYNGSSNTNNINGNNITNSIIKNIADKFDQINKFNNTINTFKVSLNNLKNAIQDIDNDFTSKSTSLKNGILDVNSIMAELKENNAFKDNSEYFEKYTESINTLNTIKLNGTLTLMREINKMLSNLKGMGGLDKLAETISKELSKVLGELTTQLQSADKSIQNAHMLQETRRKLIDESLSHIKQIMDKHMIVEISQTSTGAAYQQGINIDEYSNTPSGDNTGDIPLINLGTTPGGGETHDDKGQQKKQQTNYALQWGGDALTKTFFVDFMMNNGFKP